MSAYELEIIFIVVFLICIGTIFLCSGIFIADNNEAAYSVFIIIISEGGIAY